MSAASDTGTKDAVSRQVNPSKDGTLTLQAAARRPVLIVASPIQWQAAAASLSLTLPRNEPGYPTPPPIAESTGQLSTMDDSSSWRCTGSREHSAHAAKHDGTQKRSTGSKK
ncbi:hypothetical protein CKAH01_04636 [Colletotrichum kahawae]|uniref:Uncharacterized protein n=1 Tax=Colletotrichum kahawae TaxID=34407 RepID=A0AAD9YLG4_COLKA|nr:hypothetical protein CKAH01_04636 [Colletotrichum kahawae]